MSSSVSAALTPSPLHDRHVAAKGRMVGFAGWTLPVEYAGVAREHLAVRSHAGVFDVSHMGQIETAGPGALAFLQRLLSNDVSGIPVGGAQYALLCAPDGGVLDDLFTYRLGDDRYLTVTNAANHAADLAWFEEHAGAFDVTVTDRSKAYAMLAVQGPSARSLLATIVDGPLPARMAVAESAVADVPALICGTGYTGEDGVELLIEPDGAPAVWDAVVAAGAAPAGLAARDTLRLEACFHLYGNDLSRDRDPISAGLGWCCKEGTGFIGADAISAIRALGPEERLVAFCIDGGGIARTGNAVLEGGVVTSGTLSPSLRVGIGMAYVPAVLAERGTAITIDVRGKHRAATVVNKPIYRRQEPAA